MDAEVRRIIDEQYALARRIIEENRDKMEVMARALLDWETIDADQIDDIMNGLTPRPPKKSKAIEEPEPVREMKPAPETQKEPAQDAEDSRDNPSGNGENTETTEDKRD